MPWWWKPTEPIVVTIDELRQLFGTQSPIIGMLHLRPLPGSPRAEPISVIRDRMLQDLEALVKGGVDGVILENYGDAPYFPGRVPPHTVSYLTRLAMEVRGQTSLPLGVNMLRNDGISALAVAAAVAADFIRVNVYTGVRVSGEGLIQGEAHQLQRYRRELSVDVVIFADVDVKHSTGLGAVDLADEVTETILRGRADVVIVSGKATGFETRLNDLRLAKAAAGPVPVLVGSGVTTATVADTLRWGDGAIVGTGFKVGGVTENPVDPDVVRALMEVVGASRS